MPEAVPPDDAKRGSDALPVVVAITGASGSVYAVRLLEVLLAAGRRVHLTVSASGQQVIGHELHRNVDLDRFDASQLLPEPVGAGAGIAYHRYDDFMAPIASGSFQTAGMVVCPCSGGSLGSIARGTSDNLIHRAAEVHLKERRRLILVPRETPLSAIAIENMHRAALAGAVVLPASPGFYHGARSIGDLVDFVVARICDQLNVDHQLTRRWGDDEERQSADGADTTQMKVRRERTTDEL